MAIISKEHTERKINIFVSSVMDDMQEERMAVLQAIRSANMYLHPTYAEAFVARSESPRQVCTEQVEQSDVYIGIFKKRYGWVPTDDNPKRFSVTALEYEIARKKGIPIFIFVSEDDTGREEELTAFLKRVSDFESGHWRKTFRTCSELANHVKEALQAELVRKYTQAQVANHRFNYTGYLTELLREIDNPSSILDRIYINLFARSEKPRGTSYDQKVLSGLRNVGRTEMVKLCPEYFDLPQASDLHENSPQEVFGIVASNDRLTITGPPGSGKTTVLKRIIADYVARYRSGDMCVPLPVYVELCHYKEGLELLDLMRRGIPKEIFVKDLEEGRYILLLDGLNEIDGSFIGKAISQLALIQKNYPGNRFVYTTRPTHDFRLTTKIAVLQPFGKEQILDYLSLCLDRDRAKATALWEREFDDRLRSLVTNPLLLRLTALVYLVTGSVPRGSVNLFRGFHDFVCRELGPLLSEDILPSLAFTMSKNGVVSMEKRKVENIIEEEAYALFCRKRMAKHHDVHWIYSRLMEEGILVGHATVRFFHQAYQEYLTAIRIADTMHPDEVVNFVKIPDWDGHGLYRYPVRNKAETALYEPIVNYTQLIDVGDALKLVRKISDTDLVFACRCFSVLSAEIMDSTVCALEEELLNKLASKLEEIGQGEFWRPLHERILLLKGVSYLATNRTRDFLVRTARTHIAKEVQWWAIDALWHLSPELARQITREATSSRYKTTRKPIVAGQFYNVDPTHLRREIEKFIGEAKGTYALGAIVPTAGHSFTGQVVGAVFSNVTVPKDIVIVCQNQSGIGPPCAIMTEGVWITPLGNTKINTYLATLVRERSLYLEKDSEALENEYSAEVVLPFAQYANPDCQLVPIAVKYVPYQICEEVGRAIGQAIKAHSRHTLIIAASSMSHCGVHFGGTATDAANIRGIEKSAIEKILSIDPESFYYSLDDIPIRSAVAVAIALAALREIGATTAELVKYMTSNEVFDHIYGDKRAHHDNVSYAGIVFR